MPTNYEVTYILRPQFDEAEVDERVTKIADQIRTIGGEVQGEIQKLGKRRLAYEIDDQREGNYAVMTFTADAAQAKELERQLRLNEDVLRALLIRTDD